MKRCGEVHPTTTHRQAGSYRIGARTYTVQAKQKAKQKAKQNKNTHSPTSWFLSYQDIGTYV